MRTIIAGSRSMGSIELIQEAVDNSGFDVTVVISGTARGVDRAGEEWARINNIPVEQYPANWDRYGKSAGYRRNVEMANVADALIAIWDGQSKGTTHMITIAAGKNLPTYISIS